MASAWVYHCCYSYTLGKGFAGLQVPPSRGLVANAEASGEVSFARSASVAFDAASVSLGDTSALLIPSWSSDPLQSLVLASQAPPLRTLNWVC